MSRLFPEGVDSILDLPHPLFNAIRTGLVFLGFEELPKEEQPPHDIWWDNKELRKWFRHIERVRDAKFGGKGGNIADEPIEGPTEQNDTMELLGLKE